MGIFTVSVCVCVCARVNTLTPVTNTNQIQTDKHKLVTHNLGDISKVRRSVHVLLLRVMHTTSYLTYITKIKSDQFISLYHIGPVSKLVVYARATNTFINT